jgi:hypothetical protein
MPQCVRPNYRLCLSVTSGAAKLLQFSDLLDQKFYDFIVVGW